MMSDATEAAPTLVIGHGRDPSSDFALAAAIALARRLRGRLHIVHVVGLSDYPIDPDAADWQEQNAVMPQRGFPALSAPPRRRGRRRSVGVRSGGGRSIVADETAMPAHDRVRGDQAMAP